MFAHPLWHAPFRPFFALALAAGVLLPLVWGLAFSGRITLPAGGLSPVAWHAHEIYFGFGWAVLGGFLLTASKNWVKVRGMHGGALAVAVVLWLVERTAVFLPPSPLTLLLFNAFTVYVGGYVVYTLVRYRKQDAYPDNWFFVAALPLFLVARNLLLQPETWAIGTAMTLGLFRVAFAVMFERTMRQFMRNGMGTQLPEWRWLDLPIKGLLFVAVFEALLPATAAAALLAVAAVLLLARWFTWKPHVGMRRFEIGIMYVGYLGLVVHLALAAARYTGLFVGIGSLATHAFTFLCMGLIIPAMLIRICQGHTGRPILFTAGDRVALWLLGAGAFFRLVATQLWPARYGDWVLLSAIGWSACFLIVAIRLIPFLWQPRVDGRLH